MSVKIIQGDAITELRRLQSKSVHTCVTSPPYWGLRDYEVDGQLGMEKTPEEYISKMVAVFHEVKRVLRDDGALWLNMGDSYSGSGGDHKASHNRTAPTAQAEHGSMDKRIVAGLKPKDLVGIPWMLAFALRADGWYLRSDIIWHKPNPMPESVTDRPTKSHEYIFLMSKSPKYYYDAEAIREPIKDSCDGTIRALARDRAGPVDIGNGATIQERIYDNIKGANKRSVWTVATKPYSEAHFATFPPALIKPCILAGCPAEVCAGCGAPVTRIRTPTEDYEKALKRLRTIKDRFPRKDNKIHSCHVKHDNQTSDYVTSGWQPTCTCSADKTSGTVLDPFAGSGTVGEVAEMEGRNSILIELNPEYIKLIEKRTAQAGLFAKGSSE